MTYTNYIKAFATKAGLSQKDAKEVLVAAREVVLENIKDEDGVSIFRDLKLKADYKESRTGRNPRTGEAIDIPAKYQPRAKFANGFKEAVNA